MNIEEKLLIRNHTIFFLKNYEKARIKLIKNSPIKFFFYPRSLRAFLINAEILNMLRMELLK